MFFLWVNIINIKKINSVNFILLAKTKFGSIFITKFSLNIVTTNTVNEENIDAKEAYLNISETITQVNINREPKPYEKANKTPK